MSGIFSHAIQYEFADRNPITAVRQPGKREKIPVLLEAAELHRLFDELEARERAMIVCDALTGMRRSELMGLQWCDLDFIGMNINIVRSVVDQVIGSCKTETSRKPVVIDEHLAQVLMAWRQESMYTAPTDWVWASPQ
jgi:integrase